MKLLALSLALAVGSAGRTSPAWKDGKFNTLVTFGDSYTDENRLGYFINNNGSAPPIGWEQGVVCPFQVWSLLFSIYRCFLGSLNRKRGSVLGSLRKHLFKGKSLQLRGIWRRMLKQDHAAFIWTYKCSVPRC